MTVSEATLVPGAKGMQGIVVGPHHTAAHVGSGRIPVLATPVMVNLMEAAALAAVEAQLPPGQQTLGTRVDVTHIAATPVGMRVTAHALLVKVEGRKLTFRVHAEDERELIGEGTHERVIVNAERFERRVRDKAGGG